MHDSEIAVIGGIYEKLDEQWRRCRGKGVVDSAFNTGSYNQLIKSGQVLPTNASDLQRLQEEEATSLRQSSEWGMRGFQSSFPRFYQKWVHGKKCLEITSRRQTAHLDVFSDPSNVDSGSVVRSELTSVVPSEIGAVGGPEAGTVVVFDFGSVGLSGIVGRLLRRTVKVLGTVDDLYGDVVGRDDVRR